MSEKSDKTSDKSESQALSGKDALAYRLRRAAEERNLTPAAICRETGISPKTFSGYWTGASYPVAPAIFGIADALSCNPRWLATGLGNPTPPIELDPERVDEEERLLNAWRRLDTDRQAQIVANAELLLDMVMVPRMRLSREEPIKTLHEKGRDFRGERD